MTSLEKEWRDYLSSVYPKGVSSVQYKECEQAFYAGAFSMMWLTMEVEDESEGDGVVILNKLRDEIIQKMESWEV